MHMRVLLLSLLLVAGSQANFLTDIGDAFKTTFNSLVDQSKVVGQQLVDQLKVTGAQLASQGLQALMLNVANALTSTDAPVTEAKRQLDTGMEGMTDPNGVIYNHADELKHYMQVALNASGRLEHPETYQQTLQDFMNYIDHVVASHESSNSPSNFKKRSLEEALSPLNGLSGLITAHSNELKTYMHTAMAALSGLSQLVDQPQTYQNLMGFLSQVDKIVADHNASVDAVVHQLLQEVTSLLPKAENKRSLEDSMNAIAQGLAKVFKPNADVIKNMVSTIGDLLKGVANRVFSSLVSSEVNLGVQLLNNEHVDVLKMESAAVAQAGQTAVSALKDALHTVMEQTLTDLKPHLAAIADEVLTAISSQ